MVVQALEESVRTALERLSILIPNNLADIQAQFDAWILPQSPRGAPSRPEHHRDLPPSRLRRRKLAAFQAQYKRDRGQVLKKVHSGEDLINTPVLPESSHTFWRGLLSQPNSEDRRLQDSVRRGSPSEMGAVTE